MAADLEVLKDATGLPPKCNEGQSYWYSKIYGEKGRTRRFSCGAADYLAEDSGQQPIVSVVCRAVNHIAVQGRLVLAEAMAVVNYRGCLGMAGAESSRIFGVFSFDDSKVLLDDPKLSVLVPTLGPHSESASQLVIPRHPCTASSQARSSHGTCVTNLPNWITTKAVPPKAVCRGDVDFSKGQPR
jgi:hypothetical protein